MRAFEAGAVAGLALVLLAGPAFAQVSDQVSLADPAPVIAAEQAFAATTAQVGVRDGFLAHMADDAVMFAPEPVSAKALFSARPGKSPRDGGVLLTWWPIFAGIARSGDLGFTTGPAETNGKRTVHYFTVWKRQAGGAWKWIYDGGVANDAASAPAKGGQVAVMAPGEPSPKPAVALAEVNLAESQLAAQAQANLPAAYAAWLAADARMQGSPAAPATTPGAVRAEIATRAAKVDFTPLGGEASAAGDLAWTYGSAAWTGGGGYYVRIWRRGAEDWRIVFDQILPK